MFAARDISQTSSSFIDKLSVESGLVTQSASSELADYPPMTSLVRGGLAFEAMKVIEVSRRRTISEIRNDGEGPWFVVDVEATRFGFLSARCVHVDSPSTFCDVLFKSHKRVELESPNVRHRP